MNKSCINVGIIGIGEQGWDNLLPSLAINKNANIKAVCDVDPEKCEVAARNYGAHPYDDFLQMLEQEQLDAVVVASHPKVHAAVLRETIPRGIATFVEKPPTLTTPELYELISLNEQYQTITAIGLNFSFTDTVQFIKTLIEKPEFGSLDYVRICHYGNKPDGTLWDIDSRARSFLLSQAIHPLGLLFDLGSEYRPSDEQIHVRHSEAGFLFNVTTELANKDGRPFIAELLTSSTSPFFEWQLQLVSDRGTMVLINSLWEVQVYSKHRNNTMIDTDKWWRDTWRPSPLSGGFKRNGYEHQFTAFFDSINQQTPGDMSIERMVPIYKMIDSMEEACA